MPDLDDAADSSFDIGSAVDDIAATLLASDKGETSTPEPVAAAETTGPTDTDTPPETDPAAAAAPAPTVRPPPKSWAREKHELWSKLPPDAQEYYEVREKQFLDGIDQYKGDAHFAKELREVFTPYKAILNASGVNETEAVKYLMNAHYRLTQGSIDQRRSAWHELGKNMGLVDPASGNGADQPASAVPPEVQELRDRLNGIESTLTARQQAELQEVRSRTAKEVEAFASDPAHAYFDEVADDIVALIKTGLPLNEAYEKAVWANPATRQKELARVQTETEKQIREKAKQDADAARRATSANVRGRETRRAPTEPQGSMDDTLRETLNKINTRAHH